MSQHEDKLAGWHDYVSRTSISVHGGAPNQLCPLCPSEHVICQFTVGSLSCVTPDCPNPHHRS